MKYMLIMRANDEGIRGVRRDGLQRGHRRDGRLQRVADQGGRAARGRGTRRCQGGLRRRLRLDAPVVTDGPYAEAKELFNGFWIIEVSSKEEAAEWAKRCPLGPGTRLEVRRVNELEDFPQDNEWIQKEAGWRAEAEGRLGAATE